MASQISNFILNPLGRLEVTENHSYCASSPQLGHNCSVLAGRIFTVGTAVLASLSVTALALASLGYQVVKCMTIATVGTKVIAILAGSLAIAAIVAKVYSQVFGPRSA